MDNLEILIEKIKKCNLSLEDKNELIALLGEKGTDYGVFVVTFLRMVGVAEKVLNKLDIDIGEWIDKF